MSFYPAVPPAVTPAPGEDAAAELLGRAVMVAVRLADLASPAGPGLGKDGRSALVTAGAGKIRKGDLVVFLKPVAVAAAVVRRDGRGQGAGHPADHVRLGVAEERVGDMLLAGIDAEHRDHDDRAVTAGDLDVYSADGCLTRVPDTPANRDAFGSTGTAGDSSPYPQIREVRFSNAFTRATLAV